MELTKKIKKLLKEKNAVLMAHYYQIPEIQDIADYVGDSLELAQKAVDIDAKIILFCGVHFMAETAKIINPKTKVIIPDMEAGCSLADSCPAGEFKKFKEKYPKHKVISYINCTADIKTMTDVVCTSGNAIKIVESFPKDEKLIFAPDKNLGGYINRQTGRNMILWDGVCKVHDLLKNKAVVKLKAKNSKAKLLAHPECNAAVLELADFIGSTAQMLKYAKKSNSKKNIIASETGLLHQMKKDSPEKEFIVVPANETCSCNDCEYMKKNTLQKVYDCLKNEKPEIILDKNTIEKAKKPIKKMLKISRNLNLIK